MESADNNLNDIVLLGKNYDLKKHVYTHLEKARIKANTLAKISRLKLSQSIGQLENKAQEAYSENDLNMKKQIMDQCSRIVRNAVDRLNASEEERAALIQNETQFISHIYMILIIGNILAFAGIFLVIFYNDRRIRNKEIKLNSVNANFYAIMQGLDSVLFSFDSAGIVQTWNRNAERYFDLIIANKDSIQAIVTREGASTTAVVDTVAPYVSPESRTFKLTLKLEGDVSAFRPGMYVQVSLVYRVFENALVLDQKVRNTDGSSYWYDPETQTARYVSLEVLAAENTRFMIDEKWADTLFITDGQGSVLDGQRVSVR